MTPAVIKAPSFYASVYLKYHYGISFIFLHVLVSDFFFC
jgi:hypothetical protein